MEIVGPGSGQLPGTNITGLHRFRCTCVMCLQGFRPVCNQVGSSGIHIVARPATVQVVMVINNRMGGRVVTGACFGSGR